MAKRLISTESEFETKIGYSRAVVTGEWVFVSGCTGYDYARHKLPESVVDQAEQCMVNIAEALARAGANMDDVVRVRYVLPDRRDFAACWPVLQRWLGRSRPAATMIQAGLFEEVMKIEIEVTARKGAGGREGEGGADGDRGEDAVPLTT